MQKLTLRFPPPNGQEAGNRPAPPPQTNEQPAILLGNIGVFVHIRADAVEVVLKEILAQPRAA